MSEFENDISSSSNLVKFPGSKTTSPGAYIDDPLEELLNEFSHLEDSDFDDDIEECDIFDRANELSSKNVKKLSAEEVLDIAFKQLEILDQARDKITYLIDEIESYVVPFK